MKRCKCSENHSHDDFDAREAYQRLLIKHTQLSDLVMEYMSEAGLKRKERTANAALMAASLAIVNGEPTSDFRHCAVVNNAGNLCTGVLVHPQMVLTAAHCYDGSPTQVGLNCTSLSDPAIEKINVRRFRTHPLYQSTGTHDIAVLVLQSASNVPIVPIATAQEIAAARHTTLVGFGRNQFGVSGIKRKVVADMLRYPNIDDAEALYQFESDYEFTAGGGGFDSCNGDSGGPAYIMVNNRLKVAGVTSRGFPPRGRCGNGGIYTRIDVHLNFIRDVANEFGINF